MSDAVIAPAGSREAVQPPPVSVSVAWPWGLLALALMLLAYFVTFDEGAVSAFGGQMVHEWVHDGRHLLGFPCH